MGLGTEGLAAKGEGSFLPPPEPCWPPRSSGHRDEGVMGRTRRARRVTHADVRSHTPALELPCMVWGQPCECQAEAWSPARGLCPPRPLAQALLPPQGLNFCIKLLCPWNHLHGQRSIPPLVCRVLTAATQPLLQTLPVREEPLGKTDVQPGGSTAPLGAAGHGPALPSAPAHAGSPALTPPASCWCWRC